MPSPVLRPVVWLTVILIAIVGVAVRIPAVLLRSLHGFKVDPRRTGPVAPGPE